MTETISYEAAYNELKQIAAEIENESVSVDVLADKVSRASFLINICQEKLKSTETQVNSIISQMDGGQLK
ncbi:exodeoxyribonuclease VII small subunit [Chitinophagaceae bacterium LB-8]|uniref:Exodeoxyribonuclease VII small subunit n=1 Tax=Paraflavisolibacter caeni TaxID=2982496 RepID=A0A9X3BG80_9BACT|nr:exodeoxyribonuclease VII small subunit [Paraflavisolibacter caeni]MCU7550449.1 exodeoxyribonuclease VII small subunit [Paraflavisolibacter caeni]